MTKLVLASASAARRDLLDRAGFVFDTEAAHVDEPTIKANLSADNVPVALWAARLAEAKALEVSKRHPDAVVIGADQILVHQDAVLSKVSDRAQAFEKLTQLQGSSHQLISGAALVQKGRLLWRGEQSATLAMRALAPAAIDAYLDEAGDAILGAVGCYHLEAYGIHLFDRIDGDYFTILGLPMLDLLKALREFGVAPL